MQKELIDYIKENGVNKSWIDLAKEFKFITGEAARSFYKRYKQRQKKDNFKRESCFTVKDLNNLTVGSNKDFEIQKFITKRKEYIDKDDSSKIVPIYDSTIEYSRTKQEVQTIDSFIELYKAKIEDIPTFKIEIPKREKADKCLIISLTDLHLDKGAEYEETGDIGHINIQAKKAQEAVQYLVTNALKFDKLEKIILLVGHDFFHANNAAGTTEKGTVLDVSAPYYKSFEKGLDLMIHLISYCKEFAVVDVFTILGNHSPLLEQLLSISLNALYRKDENVNIDKLHNSRKYFEYGTSSFMLTHSVGNKVKDLPVIFAVEEPILFAQATYRYILTGHLHKKHEMQFMTTNEQYGIVFKILPSLSVTDKWHYDNMYIGNNKSCVGLVIDKLYGNVAELTYNL